MGIGDSPAWALGGVVVGAVGSYVSSYFGDRRRAARDEVIRKEERDHQEARWLAQVRHEDDRRWLDLVRAVGARYTSELDRLTESCWNFHATGIESDWDTGELWGILNEVELICPVEVVGAASNALRAARKMCYSYKAMPGVELASTELVNDCMAMRQEFVFELRSALRLKNLEEE